jgi:hypothetical protein
MALKMGNRLHDRRHFCWVGEDCFSDLIFGIFAAIMGRLI